MFQIHNLTYRYPNEQEETLREVNFHIQEGEIFGLLGPSGVGKSTTQKVLTKLIKGYGGTVKYKGKDLSSYGKDYFQDIGVGFEMPVHFSKLTAEENVSFFKKLYKNPADTDELLKRVGLYDDRNKKVSSFSKGMKARLNFVRAMINQPTMLFLDEPTNGLDPVNARIIKNMIKEFRDQGGTVLLTTHLMNDVDELCDRVAFMANGAIAEIDTPKNLKLKGSERTVTVEYLKGDSAQTNTFNLDRIGSDETFLSIIKDYTVLTIHSKETTLEDIFIEMTGVKIDE
ncbi:ATP-binding protein [Salipaludibacillus keqinensis]|uniref:ATP-binding protein n=1 Tax=Salipaludibacillus keqinensis TaxID=2045207 RepID=A0A323TI37_9BACI|nr:ABC transporter ATP-binding protein [Salipaludibacillus keqinensis]PYZ92303.1 ATP-binding protein [Salipaludibacillus keqinensis]